MPREVSPEGCAIWSPNRYYVSFLCRLAILPHAPMSQRVSLPWITSAVLAITVCPIAAAPAQSFRAAGTEFNASRSVTIPPDKKFAVVVTEFYHHGEISADGRNVVVVTADDKPVPVRILQLGPGDFCRLAFQTVEGERAYRVLYGGDPPEQGQVPPWTNQDGLLLETRKYKECSLFAFESVRDAFNSAEPIGADYVDAVQHSYNPFAPYGGPFFSRYSGYLHISTPGTYGFLTSSQDCSFLVIDDKVVVEAPGRHRPQRWATYGTRRDVQLRAGRHKFEYYHAAAGPEAMMVAAWEVNPKQRKPKPTAIPPEVFHAGAIGHLPAGAVVTRRERVNPDFLVKSVGDVPLPDSPFALVGVQFENRSPPAALLRARVEWQFGDGQTSQEIKPIHVYLKPGVYPITLSLKRGPRTLEITNRVYIDRPVLTRKDKPHTIDQYLPIISQYDPKGLDAASLCQLVLAYQFKASTVLSPEPPEEKPKPGQRQPALEVELTPEQLAKQKEEYKARKAEALEFIKSAVAVGEVAFTEKDSAAKGDADLVKLARLIGPMARFQLGDPARAGKIWYGAAQRIGDAKLRGECELEAADVALNDLGNRQLAKKLLDAAAEHLRSVDRGPVAARLARLWGDYYATSGDGEKARANYRRAEELASNTRTYIERIAWQGAHSRSTENFIKEGELDRAAEQLHAWTDQFPSANIEGYHTLLAAKYWAAREQFDRAVAMAERLLTVNPNSSYIDQLLFLAAECEVRRGQIDRAVAVLGQLVHDYPGSPLVPDAKKKLAELQAEGNSSNTRPKSPQ